MGMNFVRGYFAGSDSSGSELTGADFTGASFLSTKLGRVSAIQANFTCAVLANADFGEALPAATRFVGRDLKYANFAGAALAGTLLLDRGAVSGDNEGIMTMDRGKST